MLDTLLCKVHPSLAADLSVICRFCGQEGRLVRAHIIPEFFYRDLKQVDDLYHVAPGERPKRSPIGAYDAGILCSTCDGQFSLYEAYASQFLKDHPEGGVAAISMGVTVGYMVSSYRYDLLKLFFLSVLWRASISTLPVFSKINLGALEDKIREMLRAKSPGRPNDLSIAISKFREEHGKIIINPFTTTLADIRFCILYMGGYVIRIKLDQGGYEYEIPEWVMSPDYPLLIPERSFFESEEGKGINAQMKIVQPQIKQRKPKV